MQVIFYSHLIYECLKYGFNIWHHDNNQAFFLKWSEYLNKLQQLIIITICTDEFRCFLYIMNNNACSKELSHIKLALSDRFHQLKGSYFVKFYLTDHNHRTSVQQLEKWTRDLVIFQPVLWKSLYCKT